MDTIKGLDLNLLVVFEAIYTSGNITHAAKSLGQTQPTISNALTRLRETVNDPLFVRKGRGVEPTSRAKSMIGPVRSALEMIDKGLAAGRAFDPQNIPKNFRMVLLDQLEPVLMPHLVRQIQNHKKITLEMLHIAYEPVMDGLNDGSLDLVLAPHFPDANEIEQEAIGEAKAVVVARKDHPEIDGHITLEQFQRLDHMALIPKLRAMTKVDEVLRMKNIDRHIAYTSSKFWAFPHMLAATDLIAMLPGDFAQEAAKYFPLQVLPMPFELPEQQLYMIWKKNRTNEPGLLWLREEISKAYRQYDTDRYETV